MGLLKQAGLLGCAVPERGVWALMATSGPACQQSVNAEKTTTCVCDSGAQDVRPGINGVGCAMADSVLMAAE